MDLSGLRRAYGKSELDESAAASAPVQQFTAWFTAARDAGLSDSNAMVLSTVGADGLPSSRTVLLKEYDERGLVWYTNYDSRKGHDLAVHPYAALLFFWPGREQQVRVEGPVAKVPDEESDAYFAVRPIDSRIGAWASPQSQVIANRGVLVANAARYAARFGPHPPRPPHWGGYRLTPQVWEFWAGRASRLHDRLRYRLVDGQWVRERLAP